MPVTIDGTNGISGVDGSASTPAVQGTDTNTGMFFPAADTIAFAEGGTEVMRIDSSGNVRVGSSSTALNSINSTNTFGFKNRIINGDMRIDQRNAGASFTPANLAVTYALDRYAFYVNQASKLTVQRNAGSVTPPAGFTNYLGVTSSSAYSSVASDVFVSFQPIEGLNTADLAWGTANAATVTLSFWARSSLTGTHSGAIGNASNTRSYPYTFTISSANTWEYKTITIAGDTTGTWLTNNGAGIVVKFNLGSGSNTLGTAGAWAAGEINGATGSVSLVGTNGATLYLTGVQLEKGSTATSFDVRPYGTELALCQRYYQVLKGQIGVAASTSSINWCTTLLVQMRASPSLSKFGGSNYVFGDMVSVAYGSTGTPTLGYGYNELSLSGLLTGFTGLTAYRSYRHEPTASGNDATLFAVSAEL